MSVKSEIEKIRKQQAASVVNESVQRKRDDLERARASKQLDQQRIQLHQLAENSGLFPAIREAAGELRWPEDSISEDYEYSNKYPYNATVLKN